MFGLILLCLSLTAFFLFLRFVIWYHLTVAFWILFSPDYLVIVGGAGAFVGDHTGWLTSSLGGKIAWAIIAMMAVWLSTSPSTQLCMKHPSAYTGLLASCLLSAAACTSCLAWFCALWKRSAHSWPTIL